VCVQPRDLILVRQISWHIPPSDQRFFMGGSVADPMPYSHEISFESLAGHIGVDHLAR
jgi:hypothetical protein